MLKTATVQDKLGTAETHASLALRIEKVKDIETSPVICYSWWTTRSWAYTS